MLAHATDRENKGQAQACASWATSEFELYVKDRLQVEDQLELAPRSLRSPVRSLLPLANSDRPSSMARFGRSLYRGRPQRDTDATRVRWR